MLRFERDLAGELLGLQAELDAGTYRSGAYRTFTIHEPKPRLIAALPFRDRVLQHSLIAQLEPIWERSFLPTSYACRPGRGLHLGVDQAQRWLHGLAKESATRPASGTPASQPPPRRLVYALRTDIKSYFGSVNHDILRQQLRRRIACPRTLALCDHILDAWPEGLPIGNLTSQLWANVHLHDLDLFVKQKLHARHYARYMDDCLVLHHDKAQLHAWREAMATWLGDVLHLTLNRKTQVFPVAGTTGHPNQGRAIDWLGFRLWPDHRRLKRDSILRMRRHLKALASAYHQGLIPLERVNATLHAWVGHAQHADSWRIRQQLTQALVLRPPPVQEWPWD